MSAAKDFKIMIITLLLSGLLTWPASAVQKGKDMAT